MNVEGTSAMDLEPQVRPIKPPFLPPEDGRCLINELPPEILSHIFELGTFSDLDADDDFYDNIQALLKDFLEVRQNGIDEGDVDEVDVVDEASVSSASSWETEDSEASEGSQQHDKLFEEWLRDCLDFQVLVSHVCRRWRVISLANSSLWCVILYNGCQPMDKIETYLERAKGAPLEIQLDCTIDDQDRDVEEDKILSDFELAQSYPDYTLAKEFLELIKPHASRFRVLEVMVSHWLLMQLALETFASCSAAPMLEVLQLYFHEEADASATFEPARYREQNFILFNGDIPRLRSVTLWGVHLNWERSAFLSGLTDLELAYHPIDVRPLYRDFVHILQASPDLRGLILCQSGPSGNPVDWLGTISESGIEITQSLPLSLTLPIISLTLAFIPPSYISALLERISIPNLRRLTLDFDEDDYTEILRRFSTPGLGGIPNRSLFANLEALKIVGMPCTNGDAIDKALSEMQTVRDLNINFIHVDFLWYRLLSRPETVESENANDKKVYCPRLETFLTAGLDGDELRELVSERKKRGYPLKKLLINKDDDVDLYAHEWLKENLEVVGFFVD